MEFTSKTTKNVVHSYLKTLKFLQEEEAFVLGFDKQLAKKLGSAHSGEANSSYLFGQTLFYRIASDCTARVEFNGPVTQKGVEKLVALLELNADVFS